MLGSQSKGLSRLNTMEQIFRRRRQSRSMNSLASLCGSVLFFREKHGTVWSQTLKMAWALKRGRQRDVNAFFHFPRVSRVPYASCVHRMHGVAPWLVKGHA